MTSTFPFDVSRVKATLFLINHLFHDELMGDELGEGEAAQILYEQGYALNLPEHGLKVSFTREADTDIVTAQVESSEADYFVTASTAMAFVSLLDEDDELLGIRELIEAVAQNTPEPTEVNLVGCTLEHFAICDECRHAQLYYSSYKWPEVFRDEVASSYYIEGSCTYTYLVPSAKLYFFPAYVMVAVARRDVDILGWAQAALHEDGATLSKSFKVLVSSIRFFWEEPKLFREGNVWE